MLDKCDIMYLNIDISDPDYVVNIHSITLSVTIQTSQSSKLPIPRKGFAQRLMRHVLYIFCFYLLTSKLSPFLHPEIG